jgi:hypothetical protein
MNSDFKQIWIIVMLSLLGTSLVAQPDQKLMDAERQYFSGNYEKSLESLNQIVLMKKEQFIQKEILVIENFIALHFPEDTIRNELISIYRIDPNFDPKSLNIDISDPLEQRLNTIVVYPLLIFSIEGSLMYNLPLVHKEPDVCEECVINDHYRYNSFTTGIGFRAVYMMNRTLGTEIGFGINSAGYQRNIQSASYQNSYSVRYSENLRFLNFPIRIVSFNSGWTYKAGINYRYLIKSDAGATYKYTTPYLESLQKEYSINNSLKSRNRNLFFFSIEINKTLIDLKNQNWYMSTGCEIQMGLNSLTNKNKMFSDFTFVSDTYYTDDRVHLCFINFRVTLNYKAYHVIK